MVPAARTGLGHGEFSVVECERPFLRYVAGSRGISPPDWSVVRLFRRRCLACKGPIGHATGLKGRTQRRIRQSPAPTGNPQPARRDPLDRGYCSTPCVSPCRPGRLVREDVTAFARVLDFVRLANTNIDRIKSHGRERRSDLVGFEKPEF